MFFNLINMRKVLFVFVLVVAVLLTTYVIGRSGPEMSNINADGWMKAENGLFVGMNCEDNHGREVIFPSRWFGSGWLQVASDVSSVRCAPYFGGAPMVAVRNPI
jgi:hypothetical protein